MPYTLHTQYTNLLHATIFGRNELYPIPHTRPHTLYPMPYALYPIPYTQCLIPYTPYNIPFTLPYTLYPRPCPVPYTLHLLRRQQQRARDSQRHIPIPYALDPRPHTLYPIPYALYPNLYSMPYTPYLYPIPYTYTLYPTPYTLHLLRRQQHLARDSQLHIQTPRRQHVSTALPSARR